MQGLTCERYQLNVLNPSWWHCGLEADAQCKKLLTFNSVWGCVGDKCLQNLIETLWIYLLYFAPSGSAKFTCLWTLLKVSIWEQIFGIRFNYVVPCMYYQTWWSFSQVHYQERDQVPPQHLPRVMDAQVTMSPQDGFWSICGWALSPVM